MRALALTSRVQLQQLAAKFVCPFHFFSQLQAICLTESTQVHSTVFLSQQDQQSPDNKENLRCIACENIFKCCRSARKASWCNRVTQYLCGKICNFFRALLCPGLCTFTCLAEGSRHSCRHNGQSQMMTSFKKLA